MKNIIRLFGCLVAGSVLWSANAEASLMNDYCVVPPFIQEIAKPNLLMVIDNSASMYDLAYDDKGYKRCSTSTDRCLVNSDCPATETCTQVRNPTYCYDQTFDSATSYVGYFDNTKKYQYDFTANKFLEVASIPASCAMAAVADQVYCKLISNTLHININKASGVKNFYASGKYLNWLTASKFDVEKEVLTGGKYVTKVCSHKPNKSCLVDADCNSATETGNTCNATSAFLQSESRGCVGMGYVKDANAADFVNFVTGATDPNTDLGLTFLVKGPSNPFNPVSPSTGGQTYLEIYSKSGVPYDNEACEKAITAIAGGSLADIKQDVASCLASSGTELGICSQYPSVQCAASYAPLTPNCEFPVVSPNPHCTSDVSRSCTVDSPLAADGLDAECKVVGGSTCTAGKNIGLFCTAKADCDKKTCSLDPTKICNVTADCVNATEVKGACNKKQQTACRTDSDCISGGGNINNGPCDNYKPTYNYGICAVSTPGVCTSAGDLFGECKQYVSGYVGPCVFTASAAATKTKISFSQSMQACWAYRRTPSTPIGIDEINTVKNHCSDIYGSYKTCSYRPFQLCTADIDCGASKTCNDLSVCNADNTCADGSRCNNVCLDGPTAIQTGNPALMCSNLYEGALFEKTGTSWVFRSTMPAATPGACLATDSVTDCAKKIHTQFCNAMDTPAVTDPTNPPSTSTSTENLPAILSGIGVEAQLGNPIARLPVRLEAAEVPFGLVQEYANKIRIGLMSFNSYGSASETSTTVPLPSGKLKPTKVCANDLTLVCIQPEDCGKKADGTYYGCAAASDSDGSRVLSLVGKGHCSTDTGTSCTKKAHCSGDQTCISSYCSANKTKACTVDDECPGTGPCINYAGTHTTAGLINSIDSLRATSWTPFSEAYYNAIGYFAMNTSDTTGKSSRTGLRLNSADFPDAMNPSEYVCQANNILLVTDGSSTADQHSDMAALVDVYKSESGNVTGTCSKYAGSQNLDDLAWLARERNINTFTTGTASTEIPQKKNQSITSYVVFNGSDNGDSADCNNTTLLTKTASNGGTELLRTDIPEQYEATLRKAFESVAGGTASGTAASILSNSEGSGANILQAVFYPSKDFESETGKYVPTSAAWIGELQNLWYYVDPFIGNSSVREDTPTKDKSLHLVNDYLVEFQFKGGETIAALKKDTDGNGSGDVIVTTADDTRVKDQGYCTNATAPAISTYNKCISGGCTGDETCVTQGIVNADAVSSLWRAGRQLWERDLSGTGARTLYTYLHGTSVAGCTGSFSVQGLVNIVNWSALGSNDKCILRTILQAGSDDEAENIIKYVHGYDHSDYDASAGKITGTITIGGVAQKPRSRSVKIGASKKVWKLGDIIASTPRIQSFNKLNNYQLEPPAGYGDTTYANDSDLTGYANSTAYKERGMAYAGANDGMLHAFKLGGLTVTGSGLVKATLSDPDNNIGKEEWAFIPTHVLPYLRYLADPAYSHLYLVDGPTRLIDASIGGSEYLPFTGAASDGGCNTTDKKYWACKRDAATTANKSWRSILIGSMGIGGASAAPGSTCDEAAPCVPLPVAGVGYSSYFALDITDPANPTYLWSFAHAELGAATTGAGVVRIGHKFEDATGTYGKEGSNPSNGRWFAVVGNGPTGPIDTTYHQFKGKTANPLQLFVLDLKTGALVRKMTTSINKAFAGSMATAPVDTDRSKRYSDGFYADDALYFGYSNCASGCETLTPVWSGGIMRLLTDESFNVPDDTTATNDVDNWSLSTLVSGIGPVTTAVNKLQDRKNHNLWLYTGTGRYFFKGDDSTEPGKILAIKDPCYDKVNDDMFKLSVIDTQSPKCTADYAFSDGNFADQTSSINSGVDSKKGWFITLADEDTTNHYGAERIITEPAVMPNGAVFFTSFMPSTDICNYGGKSFMWGMRYDTGGEASASQLKGKALIQVSTGSFEEVNLSTAFAADPLKRKMTTPMVGKPPTDPPPIVSGSGNKPLKRILHIREK